MYQRIDVKYHYTRQAVIEGLIFLKYCLTQEQRDDGIHAHKMDRKS